MPEDIYLNIISYFAGNLKAQLIFLLLSLWGLIWKGVSLWRSAKNNQRNWFVILLVINTFGILEIIYIFYFSKPKVKEIVKNS